MCAFHSFGAVNHCNEPNAHHSRRNESVVRFHGIPVVEKFCRQLRDLFERRGWRFIESVATSARERLIASLTVRAAGLILLPPGNMSSVELVRWCSTATVLMFDAKRLDCSFESYLSKAHVDSDRPGGAEDSQSANSMSTG